MRTIAELVNESMVVEKKDAKQIQADIDALDAEYIEKENLLKKFQYNSPYYKKTLKEMTNLKLRIEALVYGRKECIDLLKSEGVERSEYSSSSLGGRNTKIKGLFSSDSKGIKPSTMNGRDIELHKITDDELEIIKDILANSKFSSAEVSDWYISLKDKLYNSSVL